MKIYIMKDYEAVSRKAANIIASEIVMKPDCTLGLATGGTPVGTYAKLVEYYKNGDLDFSQVKTFNLDEYRGISPTNNQSYSYYMHSKFFDYVNLKLENIHLLNGLNEDAVKECNDYENKIRNSGGIDIQLLGLGHDGHIGFNEPNNKFDKCVHCVTLADSTREANKRFFTSIDDVPIEAYTMGIGTIMRVAKILMIVNGKDKAEILKKAFLGDITPLVPASILQLHRDVTLVGDEDAFSLFSSEDIENEITK